MRIKLFEEYLDGDNSFELCSSDYLLDIEREDLTNDELVYIQKISSELGLNYKFEIKELKPVLNPNTWLMVRRGNVIEGDIFGDNKYHLHITIWKYQDEWYQVAIKKTIKVNGNFEEGTDTYKCDQLSGISDLIKYIVK